MTLSSPPEPLNYDLWRTPSVPSVQTRLKPQMNVLSLLTLVKLRPGVHVFSLQDALMAWWAWLPAWLLSRCHGQLWRSGQGWISPITSQHWRPCWLKCNWGWEDQSITCVWSLVCIPFHPFVCRSLFRSGRCRRPSQPGLRLAANTKTQMTPWKVWLRSSPTRLLHVSSHHVVDCCVLASGQPLLGWREGGLWSLMLSIFCCHHKDDQSWLQQFDFAV